MKTFKLCYVIGSMLMLVGILLPSATLIELIRATPAERVEELLIGATLFKMGLVVLGCLVMILGKLPIWEAPRLNAKPLHGPSDKLILGILATILLIASVLRLYKLDVGLWYDEIGMSVSYMQMPFGEIFTSYPSESQHFLYTLLARACLTIFGESAWSLRLPAVFFGVGSIGALYYLGRQVSSVQEALLSALLLALSYHHIWFSQNARGYTGLAFWTILASYFFLRGLSEARPQLWLLYAITAALGVYTHVTMLFVISGQCLIYLYLLIMRRKEVWPHRWHGAFLGFGLAGLFTLQLHALVLPQVLGTIGLQSNVIVWKQPLWTLLEFARGMQISLSGSVAALAAFIVFGAGIVSYTRTNPLVVQLLILPALLGSVVVMTMGHPLWPRFFFFSVGFGTLVVVRGAMFLGQLTAGILKRPKARWNPVGMALCTGLIVVSALSIPHVYAPKQDYLGALGFVEAHKQPGDLVVTVGLTTLPYMSFYKANWEVADTVEGLNSIRSRATRTWLLYTIPLHLQYEHPELMASIQHDFSVVKQFRGSLGGGTIFVCRSDVPPS